MSWEHAMQLYNENMYMFMTQCQAQKKLNRNATAFTPHQKRNSFSNNYNACTFQHEFRGEWYNRKKVINELMNYFKNKSSLNDTKATEPNKNVQQHKTKQKKRARKKKRTDPLVPHSKTVKNSEEIVMDYEKIEKEHEKPLEYYKDNANRFAAFISDGEDDIETVHDDYDDIDMQTTESEASNVQDNNCHIVVPDIKIEPTINDGSKSIDYFQNKRNCSKNYYESLNSEKKNETSNEIISDNLPKTSTFSSVNIGNFRNQHDSENRNFDETHKETKQSDTTHTTAKENTTVHDSDFKQTQNASENEWKTVSPKQKEPST